jgi:GTP 3',8-cyclase
MLESIILLKQIIDVDNKKLLLHTKEIIDYLEGRRNKVITLEVDLALACNHVCPNCTFGSSHSKVFLDEDVMEKIVENLSEIGVKGMIISGGGEPGMHKDLGTFVKKVARSGVDVTLTTNGQLIHRHFEDLMYNLKRIRLSIDAASGSTFYYTHGKSRKDFDQVIANLKKAVHFKKEKGLPIDIGVSYLICEKNADEILHAVDFYKEIGVDFLHFKPMQFWDKNTNRYYYKNFPAVEKVFSRIEGFKDNDFRVSISREKYFKEDKIKIHYNKCHGAYFDMIVGADGKVYTCCHLKYDQDYCYGDLKKESFNTVLKRVKSKVAGKCFQGCKMDAVNQFIECGKNNRSELEKTVKEVDLNELEFGGNWL